MSKDFEETIYKNISRENRIKCGEIARTFGAPGKSYVHTYDKAISKITDIIKSEQPEASRGEIAEAVAAVLQYGVDFAKYNHESRYRAATRQIANYQEASNNRIADDTRRHQAGI